MGLESFPTNSDNDKEKQSDKEQSVGKLSDQYKGTEEIGQRTSPLPPETIEKLEKLKKKQDDESEDSGEMKKAA